MEKELVELKADREKKECIEDELLQLQTKYEQLKASIPSTSFVFIFILLYGLLAFSIPFLYFQVYSTTGVKDTSPASNSVLRHINSTNDIYERLNHKITISEEKIKCPNVQQATCQPCPKCSIPQCPEMEHPKCESCVCPESEIQDCEGVDFNSANNQQEVSVPNARSQDRSEMLHNSNSQTECSNTSGAVDIAVRIITSNSDHPLLQKMSTGFDNVAISSPFYYDDMPADARPQRYADFVKSMASPNKKIEKIVGIIKAQILAQLNIIDVASEAGIIFEEDALLNPNFETEEIIKRMQKLLTDLKAIDPDWGVLFFGWCNWGSIMEREKVAEGLFRIIPEKKDIGCLQGYAISIEAAKIHITMHNMAREADAFLNILHRGNKFTMYEADPVLVIQKWQMVEKRNWYPRWFGGPISPFAENGTVDWNKFKPDDL